MKCKRCGRILKNMKSIELGYGTTCLKKYQTDKTIQKSIIEYIKNMEE